MSQMHEIRWKKRKLLCTPRRSSVSGPCLLSVPLAAAVTRRSISGFSGHVPFLLLSGDVSGTAGNH